MTRALCPSQAEACPDRGRLPADAVYAVLPVSFAFLVAYSFATQRWSRAKLFNVIICIFLAFFVIFATMYPHHQVSIQLLHLPLPSLHLFLLSSLT